MYGFRPLAGIMVLIATELKAEREARKNAFPSPCGDYGSYQHSKGFAYDIGLYFVSVPLRGLWFLSEL